MAGFGGSSAGGSSWNGTGFAHDPNPKDARTDTPTSLSLASPPTPTTPTSNQPTPIAQLPAFVDTSALVEQLVRGMTMRTLQNGVSEMRLHLSPANLGNVTMKLTVNGTSITANVIAQNADVQNALMNGQQQLARSLNAAGLTLSGFSVDVSGGHTGNGGQDRSTGFGRHHSIHELLASDESAAGTNSNALASIVGASTLELFNYLA